MFDDVHDIKRKRPAEAFNNWIHKNIHEDLPGIPFAQTVDDVVGFATDQGNKLDIYLQPHKKKKVSMSQRRPPRAPTPMNVDPHGGPSTITKRMGRSRYHSTLGTPYRRRCKKYEKEATDTTTTVYDKTLYINPMVDVAYSADDHSDNTRNTYQVYVKGVLLKACFKVRPGQTSLVDALTIRWAILVPETNTGATSDIAVSDFFMTRETTNDEFEDFPTTGNFRQYHGKRINTSKYGIMKSGTFHLGPSTTGGDTYRHWGQTKMMNIWIPLKKVFQWDNLTTGTGGESPTSNLHFVWWYTLRGDLDTARYFDGTTGPPNKQGPIVYNLHKTTYFKNIHL